jgi:hypothetical protein
MRITFTEDSVYETEGYNKGKKFKAGSTHDLRDDLAQRWLRRGVAVEAKGKGAPKPKAEAKPKPAPKPRSRSKPKTDASPAEAAVSAATVTEPENGGEASGNLSR